MKTKILTFLLACVYLISSCSEDKGEVFVPELKISALDTALNFSSTENKREVKIKTNIDKIDYSCNEEWVQLSMQEDVLKVVVNENNTFDERTSCVKIGNEQFQKTISILQLGKKPSIIVNEKIIKLNCFTSSFDVSVVSNIDFEVVLNDNWITKTSKVQSKSSLVDHSLSFNLTKSEAKRTSTIYYVNSEYDIKDSTVVTQYIVDGEYEPIDETGFEKDAKIQIASVELTPSDKYYSSEGPEKSIDGDFSTLYHSPWGGMDESTVIVLNYLVEESASTVANYCVLYPRTSQDNGIIKTAKVYANTYTDETFVEVASVNVGLSHKPVRVNFNSPVLKPKHIKVEITDAYSGDENYYFVSLAEFELYEAKSANGADEYSDLFVDQSFSQLQAGVGLEQIKEIQNQFIQNIALHLYNSDEYYKYRVIDAEVYRPVSDLATELKTSGYSQFENPTGIYFEKGEEVVVFVGNMNGEELSLRVIDFGQKERDDFTYSLAEGVNIIEMKGKGCGYINYYSNNYKTAQNIKVHLASGKVNGKFVYNQHNNENGTNILDNAVTNVIDIVGERVHLVYPIKALKDGAYNEMKDLIDLYDRMIKLQHTIMGLDKYNRVPKNHMFGRVIWDGFMYADGWGAAFINDVVESSLSNVEKLKDNPWGVAHEFGHVNQVRPGMKWVGTTECTNNIYSICTKFDLSPEFINLEHENIGGDIGNRFNSYYNNAFIKNQEWGLQGGPDSDYGTNDKGHWTADHFVKLCMMWQLQLYYHIAGEGNSWHKPWFWAEVFEKVRQTNEQGLTDGQLQVNFVKNVCDALQQDLSDFFIKTGVLQPIDKHIDDYSHAQKTITQAMIDEAVNYVSKYPKPETDYIHYINVNSYEAYKNKLSVEGVKDQGVSGSSTKIISHETWKNMTVFETYKGNELIKITLPGTGDASHKTTKVSYPYGATRIEAVAWNGKRTLVYGVR